MRRALPWLLLLGWACDDGDSEPAGADAGMDAGVARLLTLEAARLHVNVPYESLAIRVEGVVGEAAPVALGVHLLTADGEEIPLTDDGGPAYMLLDRLSSDGGRYTASAGLQAYGVDLVGGARVFVVDADDQRSASVEVSVEPPDASPDGACDPIRALDECPAGELCTRRGCEAPDAVCPSEWGARELPEGDAGVRADTSGAPPLATGTCGGGSSSHVYRFTAPADGDYLFDLRSDGHPDTLLFIRRACAVPDVAAEVGCNDDASEGNLLHSSLVTAMNGGETVYVFVDGYSGEGATGGGYRLTARKVTAPEIEGGEAFLNERGRALGARIQGTDPDDDVEVGWMLFLDDADEPVFTDEPIPLAFTSVAQTDGRFEGELAVEFLAAFDGFDRLAAVMVWVTDEAALWSEPVVLDLAPAPDLGSGAACDVVGGFGSCPGDERCANLGAAGDAPRCQPPSEPCPPTWAVTDLHAQPEFTAAGDTRDARNHGDLASCSGGGPNAPFRFVTPEAGVWRFSVTAADDADTVLYARTHCGFSQVEYELACNDDRDEGTLHSALELDLDRDQTLYLFVGGYEAVSVGAFELSAQRLP